MPKRALDVAFNATHLLFPLSLLALCHVLEQLLCQGKLSEGQAVEWDVDLRCLCLHLLLYIEGVGRLLEAMAFLIVEQLSCL